jgi:hypothetical protein
LFSVHQREALRTKVLLLEEHLGKGNPLQSEEQHDLATVGASDFSGDFDARPATELDDAADFATQCGKSVIKNLVTQPALGALEHCIRSATDLERWALGDRVRHSIVRAA